VIANVSCPEQSHAVKAALPVGSAVCDDSVATATRATHDVRTSTLGSGYLAVRAPEDRCGRSGRVAGL